MEPRNEAHHEVVGASLAASLSSTLSFFAGTFCHERMLDMYGFVTPTATKCAGRRSHALARQKAMAKLRSRLPGAAAGAKGLPASAAAQPAGGAHSFAKGRPAPHLPLSRARPHHASARAP